MRTDFRNNPEKKREAEQAENCKIAGDAPERASCGGFPSVSLCVTARNEEQAVPKLLSQINSQTYPHGRMEIVLVDSASSDNTRGIFNKFAEDFKNEYMNVRVLDNPKISQAAGWNTAIKNALGDVIIRVDAHAEIPEDFTEKNISVIKSGEYVCGGARPSTVDNPTNYKNMLLLAEGSMFGSSIAGYRREMSGEKKYVSSVFHGAYRREVFERVGGFNESLGRTEDNEFHYRVRKNGYKICFSSKIISYQHIRATLGKMLLQKYGNGKWVGLTLGVCPKCLSVFHFVPFCFVAALTGFIALALIGAISGAEVLRLPLVILSVLYLFADFIMTAAATAGAEKKHIVQLLLPGVFLLLHLSYGIGTAVGIFKMPFLKGTLRRSAEHEAESVRRCVKENSDKL